MSNFSASNMVWSTDNDYGIPTLDINMQAESVLTPVSCWGNQARVRQCKGTMLFYADDYRFERVLKYPQGLVAVGATHAAEPNPSIYDDTPKALALFSIYRKRACARYWQSEGIRIFADLHLSTRHQTINRLGIPSGWRAFATRGHQDRIGDLDSEYDIACEIAGTTPLMLVYAGGHKAQEWCKRHGGCVWIPARRSVLADNRAKQPQKEDFCINLVV
jgi:hypothetical protein